MDDFTKSGLINGMSRAISWQFYFYSLILVLFTLTASGQRKKAEILSYDTKGYEGYVSLPSGTKLSGKIIFNDNDGIVTITNGDESQSFNSRSVVIVEYYNPELSRYRKFYSLEYSDPKTGLTDFHFFEVMKEFKSFGILSKIDRIKTDARRGLLPSSSPLLVNKGGLKFTQTETIYFVNDLGTFEPYLQFTEKEIEGELMDINQSNGNVINAKLFEQYTGKHYQELVTFAKENKLSFKRKEDIIAILNHYEEIMD